jgi:hypothetical protein
MGRWLTLPVSIAKVLDTTRRTPPPFSINGAYCLHVGRSEGTGVEGHRNVVVSGEDLVEICREVSEDRRSDGREIQWHSRHVAPLSSGDQTGHPEAECSRSKGSWSFVGGT